MPHTLSEAKREGGGGGGVVPLMDAMAEEGRDPTLRSPRAVVQH
jgi:hypothetical protein